ncbi:MAG: isochorismatase family cysteine hydrolase [Eubacteriales bacterium]|nr:isochorismatase family cysteine hydrolase [Eubacteriales bacterium]
MKKILVVVDMQNDFIDGALGTKEAEAIVPAVIEKIKTYAPDCIYATRDTHGENYLQTQEGKNLPVPHCIKGTDGWEVRPEIAAAMPQAVYVDKPSFGSPALAHMLSALFMKECEGDPERMEIELAGLCTDICVVSNALLLKAAMPEVKISVDAACCAGVTPQSHSAALTTMQMCQIEVKNQ